MTPAALWRSMWSQPWLVLGFMAAVFGANGTAARLAVGEISPLVLVCARWLFASVLLALIFRREDWRELGDLMRTRWFLLGWMGLLGFSGFNALYYVAAYRTTAVNLTLMQSSMPALVLAGSAVAFRVKITPLQIVGMALTFLGVLIVAAKGDMSRLLTFAFNSGDVLVLIACVFYAVYTLGLRARPSGSPLVFFAGTALASLIWSLPIAGAEIVSGHAYWPSWKGWLVTLLIALGPSFSGQLCYTRGVDLIGPARAGLFLNLVPIFGAFCAVVALGETFTRAHAMAAVLGLGGISLAEWKGPRRASVVDAEPASDAQLP